jgi:cbb3-type cytochrome oxidase maturation protein
MTITYAIFAASVVLFGGSAVLALVWAMKDGQLRDFQRGATSIFDDEEPVGRPTEGPGSDRGGPLRG